MPIFYCENSTVYYYLLISQLLFLLLKVLMHFKQKVSNQSF